MNGYVRIESDKNDVLTLVLDAPGKTVNTLNRAAWAELSAALDRIEHDKPAGVVVASGKPRTFIAGADLFELREMDRSSLECYLREGQHILNRLAKLPCPTVAAINGDALGGGLEVALACRYRVAVDEVGTIGLPETKLGLVPGWGGTQRLARLIGLREALSMLVAGKALSPREAERLGIVDAVASADDLQSAAKQRLKMSPRRRIETRSDDAAIFNEVERDVRAKTRGQYPAQLRVIEVVRAGWEEGIDAGFAAEVAALCDLRETPQGKNLMRAFFLRSGARKAAIVRTGGEPRRVASVAIVGGGVMGSGLAHAMLKSGIPVTLVEASSDAADRAKQRLAALFNDDVDTGRLDSKKADEALKRLTAKSDIEGIASADVVIEAVTEQFDVKCEVISKIDRIAAAQAVIASNTSSLSIAELSRATKHPGRVIGLHFFNPVPKMSLVEVITLPLTQSSAAATAVALAVRIGKTPIVVGDGPGFVVNRVLMPYLSEAMRMVCEGFAVDDIDKAIVDWGMPMGPLTLVDQIGLDVISGIFNAMSPKLGNRIALPRAAGTLVDRGSLGRKTGHGFYHYPPKHDRLLKPSVNVEQAAMLSNRSSLRAAAPTEVVQRLLLPMINEAGRLLTDGVVDSTDAIDLATLLGMGFPPFRGGLAMYADSLGARQIVASLEHLALQHGERFVPCDILRTLAKSGGRLADVNGRSL